MVIQIMLILVSLVILGFFLNWVDYRFMKNKYLKSNIFDLNISCGDTSCEGVNADIVQRDVPRFVLIKDIYKLPFKDKQFKNTICSHTLEHVEDPIKFFKELERVSKNVIIVVPPLWSYGCMFNVLEHKWQFLTLTAKHENELPKYFRLPFSKTIQNIFKQRI